MRRVQTLSDALALLLICCGFAASILTYRFLYPDNFDSLLPEEVALGFFTGVATFWLGSKLAESDRDAKWRLIHEFRVGAGLNLIVQALLNYLDLLTRSLFLIVVGAAFAGMLLELTRRWIFPRFAEQSAGTLIAGNDPAWSDLLSFMPPPVVELRGSPDGRAEAAQLSEVIAKARPTYIVIGTGIDWRADVSSLLAQKLRGVNLESAAQWEEASLGRIRCRDTTPLHLLFGAALSGNTQSMVVQAVYTNGIALALCIAVSPLMGLCAVAIVLFSGFPIMEAKECSGFRNIPFDCLRFRTRHDSGEPTAIGSLLERLHLAGLPLIFNMIRGEMALVGPRPVRQQHATRLAQLVPFYSMRFAAKPGLVGWAAVQSGRASEKGAVLKELGYDLYYIKHASMSLDLEILTRFLFRHKSVKQAPIAAGAATR